jgi:hypothetical protein
MPDLLSIAPLTETVEVRGAKVQVCGVSAKSIVGLLSRFPDLRKAWAMGKFDIAQIPDETMAAIIAAGVSNIDEENAANLALDEQMELMAVIIRVTMPRGPVPFMATLTGMLGSVSGEKASPKAPATKSPKRSSH